MSDEITKENIVTDEKLQDAIDSLRDDIPDTDEMPDPDEFGGVDPEEVQEMADKTFMQRLEHLVEEDCDTEMCNRLRDSLDIEHTHDDDPEEPGENEGEGNEGSNEDEEGDGGNEAPDSGGSNEDDDVNEEPEESGSGDNLAFDEEFHK